MCIHICINYIPIYQNTHGTGHLKQLLRRIEDIFFFFARGYRGNGPGESDASGSGSVLRSF